MRALGAVAAWVLVTQVDDGFAAGARVAWQALALEARWVGMRVEADT